MRLNPSVSSGQQAGNQQRSERAHGLEPEAERADFVGQVAEDAARRQVAALDPALAAGRAVRAAEAREAVRTLRHASI
jgi:hypothetical protein